MPQKQKVFASEINHEIMKIQWNPEISKIQRFQNPYMQSVAVFSESLKGAEKAYSLGHTSILITELATSQALACTYEQSLYS